MRVHPQIELTDAERAQVRADVLALIQQPQVATLITRDADGLPRFRLVGGKVEDDFTYKVISIRPSSKIEELQADPYIAVLFKRYDVQKDGIDQPLRFVAITGRAELIEDGAGIRALSNYMFPHHLDDETVARTRCGIVVHPTRVRVEGFLPGPRYPVYLSAGG